MANRRTTRLEVGIRRLLSEELAQALLGEGSRLSPGVDPLSRVVPGPVLPVGGADRLLDL